MSYQYSDVWLVAGARTGFADYNGTLKDISATDLGIAAGRGALEQSALPAGEIGAVYAGNVAQTSLDAYYVSRHIGLYCGVPVGVPALQINRLCCSGFEAILLGADQMQLGRVQSVLAVGTESMSRNPLVSYTLRSGFRMGQVDFKDFLWEATLDTAAGARMGDTAEKLATKYGLTRADVDAFAAESFARAVVAQQEGFHAGEIVPLVDQVWQPEGLQARALKLPRGVTRFAADEHARATSLDALQKLKPAFGGVQTGGNSSAIVDGAAGLVLASGTVVARHGLKPLARVVAGLSVGCSPEIMGIGPAPAIRGLLAAAGLTLADIDRFEINEAFAAQYLAVERELGLDRTKVNVNGGAIALGHPLGATGVRCTLTVARELKRRGLRYGIASACAGGGQGTAILLENVDA